MSFATGPIERLVQLLAEEAQVDAKIRDTAAALTLVKKRVSESLAQHYISMREPRIQMPEDLMKEEQSYERLLQALQDMKSEIAKGQVTISELKGRLTVNMVDAILFDSGRAEIKPDGLVVLGKVIEILKSVDDKAIRIEGHTDAIPISGSLTQRYPTNWELSAARAINVARYLQKQAINPAHLSAAGFGEFKPVADNATLEGRAKNRRIEIVLVPKD